MLRDAAFAQILEAEALVLEVLDRVDASHVGHHVTVLAELAHGVARLLELVHRASVDRRDSACREARMQQFLQ